MDFKIYDGSLQDRFQQSRAKVQMMAGGFANGKTANMCVKTLTIAKDYAGANILMARATYPKLNDTLRKEFFKWCPTAWIESFVKIDNIVTLKNGTTINFRYVQQQSKAEGSTSNLLSATYDLIVVDQVEDPEIGQKDFFDLLGRLRGSARYIGDDPTMPITGPRWMLLSCNPSRNWVYRSIVKPIHIFNASGIRTPDLLVDKHTKRPIVDLFEGSTYENKDNLEADYIDTLEQTYTGQMRERFLLGKWAAYEGLVYPEFDPLVHELSPEVIQRYITTLRTIGYEITWFEGYDYGLAAPACYLLGFTDDDNNVFIVDGFYETEQTIERASDRIRAIRTAHGVDGTTIYADPSIFRRVTGDKRTVGKSIAGLFDECGITMQRGNNDINNGIIKVKSYLTVNQFHRHPILNSYPAPRLYLSTAIPFVSNEMSEYYWKRDPTNDVIDRPVDKNDHALDTIKYMLSDHPQLAVFNHKEHEPPAYMFWHEVDEEEKTLKPRQRA